MRASASVRPPPRPARRRGRRRGGLAVIDSASIEEARRRLGDGGGYEVVHESPGLEIGVYALVAPEPDRQQPHSDDEVYVVLEGTGVLDVGDESVSLRQGDTAFVPAGAEHRFSAYEELVVLVIFARPR